jgi:hypothetical protein
MVATPRGIGAASVGGSEDLLVSLLAMRIEDRCRAKKDGREDYDNSVTITPKGAL